MPYTRAFTLLIATTLMLTAVPGLAAKSRADQTSPAQASTIVVSVEPFLASVPIGGTTQVQVNIENPTGVIAFEIKLSFDPTVIQIQDQDTERPGVQVGLGSLLNGREYFPATNAVDNTAGTIDVAVTLMGATSPIHPINENGDLITISARGETEGASPLALTKVDLIDVSLSSLSASLVDGVIVVSSGVTVTPSATATPTTTPSATGSPTPTATEITASATPTPTSTSTPTEPAASPTPSATAIPSSTATVDAGSPTPSPTGTSTTTPTSQPPTATSTATATATITPTSQPPTATSTATATATITPTTTAKPAPTFAHHIQLPLILRDFQIGR